MRLNKDSSLVLVGYQSKDMPPVFIAPKWKFFRNNRYKENMGTFECKQTGELREFNFVTFKQQPNEMRV